MTKEELIFLGYERRSKVNFIGNVKYKPFNETYIWAILKSDGYNVAYIQHPEGLNKSEFEATAPFANSVDDGVSTSGIISDIYFDDEVKFIEATEDEIVLSDEKEREERNSRIKNLIFNTVDGTMFLGYKRGSKVNFCGNESFKPLNETYIWAFNHHLMSVAYIEHPQGSFFTPEPMGDGFESPHSSNFDATKKYIQVEENEIILSDLKERGERMKTMKELLVELNLKIK